MSSISAKIAQTGLKIAFTLSILCHYSNSFAARSCKGLFNTPNINFNDRNKLSEAQTRFRLGRGYREAFVLARYRGHISRINTSIRVRDQNKHEICVFASMSSNFGAYLKRKQLIQDDDTLIDALAIAISTFQNSQATSTGTTRRHLSAFLENGATSLHEFLNVAAFKKLPYLTAEQISLIGGDSKVSSIGGNFLDMLLKKLEQNDFEISRIFSQEDFDTFLTEIIAQWGYFVELKTGENIFPQTVVLDESVQFSEILYAGQYNNGAEPNGALITRLNSLASADSDGAPLAQLVHELRQHPETTSTEIDGFSLTPNISLKDGVIVPIIAQLSAGKPVTISLRWSKSNSGMASAHAITLTGYLVHPETKVFEGFIYRNSHSSSYGLFGDGFISRKDFEESLPMTFRAVYF